MTRVALGIDVRERRLLAEFPRMCNELRQAGVELEVLYLEATDDVLVRRFSETRRPHPAAEGGSLADGIRREREKLRPLREVADRVLDTSALTVHELRAVLRELVERAGPGTMTVSLVSFGYKYGLPSDADLAIDCRFLPNPFFVEELRHRTGADPAVAEYVLAREETEEFLRRLTDLLDFALPRYQREGAVTARSCWSTSSSAGSPPAATACWYATATSSADALRCLAAPGAGE
ncbi:MAG: RNase adaptor protein RapZ [Deltaproteobacteria bacterium]|nr:MAG: RNase adaptor protein RapZ [Deltaproteobacteria bacterium]